MPLEYRNAIVTGDARELATRIPDESVDLIFTDPPYPREYEYVFVEMGEYAPRILKPGGSLMTLCGHYQVPMVIDALRKSLEFFWICKVDNQSWARLFGVNIMATWKPMLWFKKGHSITPVVADGVGATGGDKRFHEWGQSGSWAMYYLDRLTTFDTVTWDPFTGGGTVPAVCKMLGRNYVASEIDPDTAERARQRVLNTQPPLFVLEPQQLALPVSTLEGGSN